MKTITLINIIGILYIDFSNIDNIYGIKWNIHLQLFRYLYIDISELKLGGDILLLIGLLKSGLFKIK